MRRTAAEQEVIRSAIAWMESIMSFYDPSHDALHVQRVHKTALTLATQLSYSNPDLLVVELAAIFHDLLDKKFHIPQDKFQEINNGDDSDNTFAFLLPFFEKNANLVDLVSSGRARTIAKIVDNVSWSTETALRDTGQITEWHESCVELHCVQDADRLDAMGAIGIMRCAGFSCVKNRALVTPGHYEDPSTAVGHVYEKLLHIKSRLKTEPGKRMGDARHKFMVEFLRVLRDECSGDQPQGERETS